MPQSWGCIRGAKSKRPIPYRQLATREMHSERQAIQINSAESQGHLGKEVACRRSRTFSMRRSYRASSKNGTNGLSVSRYWGGNSVALPLPQCQNRLIQKPTVVSSVPPVCMSWMSLALPARRRAERRLPLKWARHRSSIVPQGMVAGREGQKWDPSQRRWLPVRLNRVEYTTPQEDWGHK